MPEYNKLRDALQTIKTECSCHKSGCTGCPMLIGDWTCGVTGIEMLGTYDWRKKPMYWELPEIRLIGKVEG